MFSRLAILLALVVLLAFGIRTFKLNEIKVSGSTYVANEELARAIEPSRGISAIFNNTLIFSRARLLARLKAANPAVSSASFSLSGTHTLIVRVNEKKPLLTWETRGNKYDLDSEGLNLGISKNPGKLPLVIDGANLPQKVGDKVASPIFVEFVSSTSSKLNAISIKIKEWRINNLTSEVYAQTDRGYDIKFDTMTDPVAQVENLRKLIVQWKSFTPKEYVDLRVAGKAFYK